MKYVNNVTIERLTLLETHTMPLNEKDKSWLQQNFTKNSDIGTIIQNAVSAAIAPLQKEITDLKSMLTTKDKRIKWIQLNSN